MVFEWTQLWSVVVIPTLSGLAGFIQNNWENYWADKKFDKYEWAKTVETIAKFGIPSTLAWLALSGFNINVDAWAPTLVLVSAYWIARLFKLE